MQRNTAPITLESMAADLAEIKNLLRNKPPSLSDDLITPKEFCEQFSISRSKFEYMKRTGVLTTFSPFPETRHVYLRRSEVSQYLANV
jgi:hypothetical protein